VELLKNIDSLITPGSTDKAGREEILFRRNGQKYDAEKLRR
jgi:hypothetical protein